MKTSPAVGLVVAGIVAAIAILFLGILALILAFVLLGGAILVVAGEVEGLLHPVPKEAPHPMRYACSGCGGDVYLGQTACPACGHALQGGPTPTG
jgi:hypothetical protein